MLKSQRFLPVLLFITTIFIGAIYQRYLKPHISEALAVETPVSGINPLRFYDKDLFINGIKQVEGKTQPLPYHIYSGITPHHILPSFILADFYQKLAFQHPKTVILIGPNHYERGNFKALTSGNSWETPFGLTDPDSNKISNLILEGVVEVDDNTVSSDHAVASSIPYLKYFIPDAKIVPILLSKKMTIKDSQILSENLVKLIGQDTVLVAAVDFSHYLTELEAAKKDDQTLEVLKSFNYQRLYDFNNDYLDSPASIGVLLMTMQKLNKTNFEILNHSNSGDLAHNQFIPTTSYFETVFF